jgi:hypothetical protein
MSRYRKLGVVAASAAGAVLALYVLTLYTFTALTNRYGPGWMLMVAHPRDAYAIRRGPRVMDWQGMHIEVDSEFVLARRGESVMASHINRPLWLLGPSVVFVDAERTNGSHFASEEAWCASASDRCAVHQLGPASGSAVCVAYHGTREKAWTSDIESWRCRLPSGIEARFSGRASELAGLQNVVEAAFATAPRMAEASAASGPQTTVR